MTQHWCLRGNSSSVQIALLDNLGFSPAIKVLFKSIIDLVFWPATEQVVPILNSFVALLRGKFIESFFPSARASFCFVGGLCGRLFPDGDLHVLSNEGFQLRETN